MALAGIAAVGGALPALPTLPTNPTTSTTGVASPDGQNFGDLVSGAIDNLQATQDTADTLATQVATGELTDVHDYTIAATKASLATELTVAVRNKAVEAFNSIMSMQV
jgi:flagellar hook-basal body complex protein FliE